MLIGFREEMTHIDLNFIRSKVKDIMIAFVKKIFSHIVLRIVYYRVFLFRMLNGLVEDMTPIYLFFTTSKALTPHPFIKSHQVDHPTVLI